MARIKIDKEKAKRLAEKGGKVYDTATTAKKIHSALVALSYSKNKEEKDPLLKLEKKAKKKKEKIKKKAEKRYRRVKRRRLFRPRRDRKGRFT